MSRRTCYLVMRGGALGIHQGGATHTVCGGGSESEQYRLPDSLLVFSPFPHYPQAKWVLLVLIPGGWACVHSGTLWVSPKNSPVRLGVSPAATSTPTGVFNQRFEALFPCTGALGCLLCFAPQLFLSVYLHANGGPLLCQLPPRLVHQPLPCREFPPLPGCPSPPLLPVWMNVSLTLWSSDCHTV